MIVSVNSNIEHKLAFICKKLGLDHKAKLPDVLLQFIAEYENANGPIPARGTKQTTSVPFSMLTCFKKHYKIYFEKEYVPMGAKEIDLRHLKLIQNKIVQSAANQTDAEILAVLDEDILFAFDLFLGSMPQWWIKNNFTPKSLASNFEKILSQINNEREGKQQRRKHSLEDFLGSFKA